MDLLGASIQMDSITPISLSIWKETISLQDVTLEDRAAGKSLWNLKPRWEQAEAMGQMSYMQCWDLRRFPSLLCAR